MDLETEIRLEIASSDIGWDTKMGTVENVARLVKQHRLANEHREEYGSKLFDVEKAILVALGRTGDPKLDPVPWLNELLNQLSQARRAVADMDAMNRKLLREQDNFREVIADRDREIATLKQQRPDAAVLQEKEKEIASWKESRRALEAEWKKESEGNRRLSQLIEEQKKQICLQMAENADKDREIVGRLRLISQNIAKMEGTVKRWASPGTSTKTRRSPPKASRGSRRPASARGSRSGSSSKRA